MDEAGGRRLEFVEEEVGWFKPQLEDAMHKMETGILQALAALNSRVDILEQKVEGLLQIK